MVASLMQKNTTRLQVQVQHRTTPPSLLVRYLISAPKPQEQSQERSCVAHNQALPQCAATLAGWGGASLLPFHPQEAEVLTSDLPARKTQCVSVSRAGVLETAASAVNTDADTLHAALVKAVISGSPFLLPPFSTGS